MALTFLASHKVAEPALVKRCQDLLTRGVAKLATFESPSGGFEWFGGDPGHPALTAFGLMQLIDIDAALPGTVDGALIARARRWLLEQRDGNGGFRAARGTHAFGHVPDDTRNAYILWALAEAGLAEQLGPELRHLELRAAQSRDPYLLALAANALHIADRRAAYDALVQRLIALQTTDGLVIGQTSITCSGERDRAVETSALAALAWLREPDRATYAPRARLAIAALHQRCHGGRFGATQATVLALKAIVAHDIAHGGPGRAGSVTVSVDGAPQGRADFGARELAPVALPDVSHRLRARHTVALTMAGGTPMPYTLVVRCHTHTPASSDACHVKLDTELARATVKEGESVDLRVRLRNRTADGLPMVVAVIGVPGGLEVRHDQLKEHVRARRVAFYETRGRDIVLYWRGLRANADLTLPLSCVAAVPGRYQAPASRAYLYYTAQHADWASGPRVVITR